MSPRFPGEVPRIGANTSHIPQHVEVDTIEVFYQGPHERKELFKYRAPDDNPNKRDMRAFKFDPNLGLDIEKYDRSHTYIPISAIAKVLLRPAPVPDADTQIAELLNTEGKTDGEES